MKTIYLDNAATTALDPDVLEQMLPWLMQHHGNPSSIHGEGRKARLAIEQSRKKVAELLGVKTNEILFTSGGTESNNMVIASAVRNLHCTHIITSPIEHHAVLNTVKSICTQEKIGYSFVKLLPDGHIDLNDLERLLDAQNERTLVSLMHANNEIGNLLDIEAVGKLCRKYNALFHSDGVQTIGHYPMNLSQTYVHFMSASAHKFHGPKGVGICYVNGNNPIKSLIVGGGQERGLRAGTENVAGIVGFATALEIAMKEDKQEYIQGLKDYLKAKLLELGDIRFNGDSNGLYTVLNVAFPKSMSDLLFELDQQNICASGGSACSSGSGGSHVLSELQQSANSVNVRFSFSKNNNLEDTVRLLEVIKQHSVIPLNQRAVLHG